ncbi:hypothetical protein [Mucilaginibacter terrae]|uniref:Hydrogenase/urease accessory protein HupE n=1 Tax=Mucilaginibacter terrae TaxID=1955052 RepID=A0ABU3GVD0_9SPHI|nr:hypothetical protein [Mucilaginibacter terrae]MDT3403431.1 hydrogenase/urease accessory protein HupE [Mucilaginibacter terrae]
MKSNLTQRQKLIVPFLIFSGMIAVGVRSMYKGMLMHQDWRVALAIVGIVCCTTMLGMMIITLTKQEKAQKKSN